MPALPAKANIACGLIDVYGGAIISPPERTEALLARSVARVVYAADLGVARAPTLSFWLLFRNLISDVIAA